MPASLCIAIFAALLIMAALEDLRSRRIPNWLVLAIVVLWTPWLAAGPAAASWYMAIGVAATTFLIGTLLFARRILGGGDVKLITAVTLWAGLEHFALFAAVMSLTGGLLALASLAWQRYGWMIIPYIVPLRPTAGPLRPILGGGADATDAKGDPLPISLPYGIAIAAGGLAVVAEHLKLI
jgi:prepilin peptidase CpaA